jgi:hypothetical protein
MVEWLNGAGLIFGFLGAVVLIKYPSPVALWVTRYGDEMITFTNSPTLQRREANKIRWQRHMFAYRAGVGLLALGFFLQLTAMLPLRFGGA